MSEDFAVSVQQERHERWRYQADPDGACVRPGCDLEYGHFEPCQSLYSGPEHPADRDVAYLADVLRKTEAACEPAPTSDDTQRGEA